MGKVLLIWLLICPSLAAQWPPFPHTTGLTTRPFYIRNIWYIGGVGTWDSMTMDPATSRLYIAHGRAVQVVDVRMGDVTGEIKGLAGARAIALDNRGENGYISDGPGNRVVVFNRETLQTVAEIATKPDPRSLVYEPLSGLVFVVQAAPPAKTPNELVRTPRPLARKLLKNQAESYITVIDPQTSSVLGWILVSGALGPARAGGGGQVYIGYADRDAILHFSAEAVEAEMLHSETASGTAAAPAGHASRSTASKPVLLDWTGASGERDGGGFHEVRLGGACGLPRGFALDSQDGRLFAACDNMTLEVLNTATGQQVTTLPIGAGVDEIGYDPVNGYLFAASGAADGTLTIIRRDSVTDSYAIVQNLPTRRRAFVMAVDPENGGVYLVTDLLGVDLNKPGGIGKMKMEPIEGSFQVIEIGE